MTLPWIIVTTLAGTLLAVLLFLLYRLWKRKRAERRHRDKGTAGENFIASLLKHCMEKGDTLLNNVILSNPRTRASFEIDHILLSRRGIFVIETKNRSGDIYGDDEAERWVQVLGKGDIRHEFYSPVKQCLAHADKVISVTGCKNIYPMVVFAEGNTAFIQSTIVYTPNEMCGAIKACKNCMSEKELSATLSRLRDYMRHSISPEEHKRNVQKKYGE